MDFVFPDFNFSEVINGRNLPYYRSSKSLITRLHINSSCNVSTSEKTHITMQKTIGPDYTSQKKEKGRLLCSVSWVAGRNRARAGESRKVSAIGAMSCRISLRALSRFATLS